MPRTTTPSPVPHATKVVYCESCGKKKGVVLGKFYYTYVLESLKDYKRYVGYTTDLRKRLREHSEGKSFSTKARSPFRLIYCEVCLNEEDARRREQFFKQTKGRRFITKRLKAYYDSSPVQTNKVVVRGGIRHSCGTGYGF